MSEQKKPQRYGHLYCVAGQSGALSLRRLKMTGELQTTITQHFSELEDSFFTGMTAIEFAPSYDPDPHEYLLIDGFVRPEFLAKAEKNPDTFTVYSPSTIQAESPIKAILCVLAEEAGENPVFLFQHFDRRKLLNRDKLTILFRGGQFSRLSETGIMIGDRLDAVIRGTELCFRSFHLASQFLPLTEYFKEANDEDVRTFLSHELFIGGNSEAVLAHASQVTKKRISMVLKSGILNVAGISAEKIQAAAKAVELELKLVGKGKKKKIEFPDDSHVVRELLQFLAEGMYVGLITGDPYIANSYRPLKRK